MLFLITSAVSLVIGFVLGRVWEIRQSSDKEGATRHAYRARLVIVTLHWPTAWLRHATWSHPTISHKWAFEVPAPPSPHAEIPQKRQRKPNYDTRCDLDEVGYRYDLQQATAAHDVPGSVNSILSEHHDQSGKRNGNQENRPIHNIKAKEPRHRLSILIVKHMRSLAFGSTTVSEAL